MKVEIFSPVTFQPTTDPIARSAATMENRAERQRFESSLELETDGRRSSRLASFGQTGHDQQPCGIPPRFSEEARARWAADRESRGIEQLFGSR